MTRTEPDTPDPAAAMRAGALRGVPVEPFGPVHASARVRLARAGWETGGTEPFLSGAVPYAATSGGRLSADAVAVALAARPGASGLRVLEVGAGTGVFARLFLSALREAAPRVHAATRYVATDASPSVLAAMAGSGVLAGHEDRVEMRELDLSAPGQAPGEGFDLVIATYVLDVMPFDLLAVRDGRVWRREVRGVLEGADEARAGALRAALAGPAAGLAPFVDLGPRLGMQVRHVEVDRAALPHAGAIPDRTFGEVRTLTHPFGAIDAVLRCMDWLAPGGAMLLADYAQPGGAEPLPGVEGYGTSISAGIDFAVLDAALSERAGLTLWRPREEAGALVVRVLGKGAGPDLGPLVDERFGALAVHRAEAAVAAAREAAREGRIERARAAWAGVLAAEPRSWPIMREAAFFLLLTAGEAEAAGRLALRGLDLNPLDPDLWRVRAEAALAAGEAETAAAASARACALAPGMAHAHHTRARVLLAAGDTEGALLALARGLAADRDGGLRAGLMAVQADVMAARDADRRADLRRRADAFRLTDAGPQ